MNDHATEVPDLSELLEQVAGTVDPPRVPASDDLARGRRRLRRRRTAVAAVAVAGVVAVAGGTAALAGGAGGAAAPGPSATVTDRPSPTPTPTPSRKPAAAPVDAKQLLTDDARVIGEYLDPSGTHLDLDLSNAQTTQAGLGSKLGWTNAGESGLGEVEFFVSDGWGGQFNWFCDHTTPCDDVVVDGVHVRRQTVDGVTSTGVRHDDGTVVVISVDALFGNNSSVAVSGIDVTPAQVAHAAADPRLVAPTQQQIAGLYRAFGWPSP